MILLLTSSIDLRTTPQRVLRHDLQTRLDDYKTALVDWLARPVSEIDGIVFADNTAYDLSELEEFGHRNNAWNKPLEFLSLGDNNIPPGIHYGYAELGLIDDALRSSAMLGDSYSFVKATGRLTFPDFSRLITRLPDEYDAAVDARCRIPAFRPSHTHITTQIMLFNSSFYRKSLTGVRSRMTTREGERHAEHVVYQALREATPERGIIYRFPVNCEPVGVGAAKQKFYSSSSRSIYARGRALSRRVSPQVWL
ncbi:hypothetical protein GB931_08310 [Modestobacter sp. I12A-02628]|uniref:Uncharacterized protein n=1 Tax=Goekera deserti TaxID=2497753 RepID=A0A7K3WH55_9ACTN|nr:hypothetical protein [Goekera deserti]MPQ97925.1 hypothetical protein [Goekera deserti]NDI48571.1 hypothetical protein [Goekera deserti]NEL55050.1 hypothetical protein [Goekera deserti]